MHTQPLIPTSVSVVIRCCNEEQHIARLLTGIAQQSIACREIIVVDSGSTDATVEIAAQFPVKVLHISQEEFSFGRSLNIGCREATGDFIVIASAHVYPDYRDWLEQLLKPFSDERVALVYGKQRGDHRTKFSEHQIFSSWFGDDSQSDQKHPFCNNANAAIRRSVWCELHYDESLTGLEDLDWAAKALQKGHRLAYQSAAVIRHVHDETWERVYHRYRREAIALKRIRPEEHFDLVDFLKLLVFSIGTDLRQASRSGKLLETSSIVMFRLMQYLGTYRGFRQRGGVSNELKRQFYYPKAPSNQKTADSKHCHVADLVDYSESCPSHRCASRPLRNVPPPEARGKISSTTANLKERGERDRLH